MRIFILFVSFLFSAPSFAQHRYEFSAGKLGTLCKIVFYASDSLTAQKASKKAWNRIDELNEILSDYNENSEIRRLSDSSGIEKSIKVSKPLYEIIEKSVQLSQLTKGAFDITVGNYVQLWRRARRQKIFPTKDQLAKAKKSIGYKKIKLYPHYQAVVLKAKDMRLDVGGIGKGYIADKVLKLLDSLHIQSALVDLGGDISVSNAPPQQQGWQIETGYKDENEQFISRKLLLKNCAVATSGDLFQFVVFNGKRYSHIVNPQTGLGIIQSSQVTIIAQDGATADALASAVSVMGEQKGLKLAKKLKNITLLFIHKPFKH
jgi:thiamine biosynthesis lipoprotein